MEEQRSFTAERPARPLAIPRAAAAAHLQPQLPRAAAARSAAGGRVASGRPRAAGGAQQTRRRDHQPASGGFGCAAAIPHQVTDLLLLSCKIGVRHIK